MENPELCLTAGRDHGANSPREFFGLRTENNDGDGWDRFLHSEIASDPFIGEWDTPGGRPAIPRRDSGVLQP